MRKLLLKLRKRRQLERDLDEELALHRALSSRPFGNSTRIREEARELWTFPFIESLLPDLRYASRSLIKSPSYTLVCILTLSLGISINTAVFTLYDSLTYRLLPVNAPEDLVRIVRQSGNTLTPARIPYPEFEKLRSGLKGLADLIATTSSQTIPAIDEGMKTQFVAGDYFAVLGIHCDPGTSLRSGHQATAVMSHAFWTRRFHKDPAVVGKVITLAGARFTVVGVAPQGFYGTDLPPRMPDLWIPLTTPPEGQVLQVLARPKPGVSVSQVADALQISKDGQTSRLTTTNATAFQTNLGEFRGTGTISLILMGAVGVILLIGCVNLINLTMSRNAARRREIAVRLSIGAARSQIIQQLCAESLVLGIAGGAVGFGLSVLLCHWIQLSAISALDQISNEILGGFQLNVSPDWRVLAYTLALSLVTSALIGIYPALTSTRTDLSSSMKSDGVPAARRHLLLTAQIATCFILLAGAGLLFRGTWRSRSADAGYDTTRILLMSADLTTAGESRDVRSALLRRVLDRARSLPEVMDLALVDRAPFLGTGADQFANESHKLLKCRFNAVSGGYFDTLRIPILAGRSFSQAEAEQGSAEVVISEAAAQFYWPGQNAVGRRVIVDKQSESGLLHSSYTVIGVAKVVRSTFLSKVDDNYLYFPKPVSETGGWVLLRTRHSPDEAIPSLRSALMELSPALASHSYLIPLDKGPIQVQKLMTDIPGMIALLLGVLALILASVGVFGVVMYLVAQRIRVIGIHIALGAQRPDVIWLVLHEGLGCVAWGTLIGLFGAVCLSGLLAALVKTPDLPDLTYQAGVFDPATFLIALGALTFAVAAACLLPVYRATRVDPVIALRGD